MTDEPFVIASSVPVFDDLLEYDLLNLELRLKMQKKWVEKTESEIEDLKERIKKNEREKTV